MSVRVGFVGCGGIARAHLGNLSKMRNVKLVGFADPNEERATAAAQDFGGKAYTNYCDLYGAEKLDAVFVCVPPFAHGDAETDAAKMGAALFVEKPVNICVEAARRVEAAIKKAKVVSSVGYHWRYYDITDRCIKLLARKTVGMALGWWVGGFPGVAWWRRMEESAGQIVEQCTHIFDLARFVVGDIVEVHAYTALRTMKDVEKMNVPDVGVVNVKFANGAIGNIATSCMLSQGYQVGLHVLARDLILKHQGGALEVVEPQRSETVRTTTNAILEEDKAFIRAVATGDTSKIRSDYADGARSFVVTMAANESAATGKVVKV